MRARCEVEVGAEGAEVGGGGIHDRRADRTQVKEVFR